MASSIADSLAASCLRVRCAIVCAPPECGGKVARGKAAGKLLAENAKAAGISTVVFDRNGYRYHGRVQAVADGAREGGLEF